MADKQIGIKLDVKQTGLQQVDDSLSNISKSLKDMNDKVIKQQTRGWGSDSQTKEMREQLRYLQQILQLNERIARTNGLHSESFGNFNAEMSRMNRDISNVPTRSRFGGYIQDRFGEKRAQMLDESVSKISNVLGKLAAAYGGFSLLSTLHQGMSTGDQLAFGLGDLAKRMNPSVNSLNYGRGLLNGLQNYGYRDTDLMQSAIQYGGITGRIDPKNFQSQMQAIVSTGQRFGWDLNSTTQYFGNAYSAGITGGSTAQMNPQEFATLVANATVQAHMQGRESQMMNQLTQLTQMTLANGSVGNAGTMSAFLAMGDRSGNQALINRLPGIVQNMDSAIKNPGSMPMQAFMMRAIGGGKMDFWQEQFLQSQGAFGTDKSGVTNIQKVTDYLMQTIGTQDPNRLAVMLGNAFNISPSDAKNYIDNYTKGGKFSSDALNDLKNKMNKPAPPYPPNATDQYRNNQNAKDHAANQAGMGTTGARSWVDGLVGDALNVAGEPLIYGGMAYMAGRGAYSLYKGGKWIYNLLKGGGGSGGPGIPPTAPESPILGPDGNPIVSTAESTVSTASKAGGWLSKLGKWLGPIGEITGLLTAGDWGTDLANKAADSVFGTHYDPSKPITEQDLRSYKNKQVASGYTNQSINPSIDPNIGTELAPVVVSTLVALQGYQGQLKSLFGNIDSSNNKSDSASNNKGSSVIDLLSQQNQMYRFAMSSPGSPASSFHNAMGGFAPGKAPMGPVNISSGVKGFVNQMIPYAQVASQKTGLPVDFILGQWGHESGWGTSYAAHTDLNFAGIKPWSGRGAGPDANYAGYSSLSDWANGYADFLTQNPKYSNLLNQAKNGASDEELTNIIGGTGYAEDSNYTNNVMNAIMQARAAMNVKGEVTVNVKQPDGSTTVQKAPINATFTGIQNQ